MKPYLTLLLLALLAGCGTTGKAAHPAATDLPQDVNRLFVGRGLDRDYSVYRGITPNYLKGDFEGDSKEDVAIVVTQSASQKVGIVVIAASGRNYVLGAGRDFGNGGDNFTWMDRWKIHEKSKAVRRGVGEGAPPRLKGDALFAEKEESCSCIIYYDGSDFKWYQQAD